MGPWVARSSRALGAALLLAIPLGPLGAQEVSDTVPVDVRIEILSASSGAGVENAMVHLPELRRTLFTDARGRADLLDVLPGSYRMTIARLGYEGQDGRFTILREGSFQILMTPAVRSPDLRPGDLIGRVTRAEDGAPLAGAAATITGTGIRALTDERGWFVLSGVPVGVQEVQVSYLGRQTMRDSVLVRGDRTLELDIGMPVEAIELERITVTSHSRALTQVGFFRRRRQATAFRGRQWTADELAEADPVFLGHVLQEIPTVRRRVPGAFEGTNTYLTTGRGCRPTVFVDDLPMDSFFDIDNIDPRRVEALEIYFGSLMPGAYIRHCAVILVWLKQRFGPREGG